jgi:hypothetical protein
MNKKTTANKDAYYFMAGYVMKMSNLVPNINLSGQKDLSFKVRHKAYVSRYAEEMSA